MFQEIIQEEFFGNSILEYLIQIFLHHSHLKP